jgi:hypothetical protein
MTFGAIGRFDGKNIFENIRKDQAITVGLI